MKHDTAVRLYVEPDLSTDGTVQLTRGSPDPAGVDRIGPVRDIRQETEALRERLEDLESALTRLESDENPSSPRADARQNKE